MRALQYIGLGILAIVAFVLVGYIFAGVPVTLVQGSLSVPVENLLKFDLWKLGTIVYCFILAWVTYLIREKFLQTSGLNIFIGIYVSISVIWILMILAGWMLPPIMQSLMELIADNIGVVLVLLFILYTSINVKK
ncbi:hypothetical protein [Oceanobacillus timonensis]|uniref:hypothetical protein n=1 Tax=Oceanobacillus timonensis TaxID=1926285 RepID=UPI0009BC0DA4|nr:hypothetical protein [Oceanobacillus timonensis]